MQTLNLHTKYETKNGRDALARPYEAQGSGVCQVVSSTFAVAAIAAFSYKNAVNISCDNVIATYEHAGDFTEP